MNIHILTFHCILQIQLQKLYTSLCGILICISKNAHFISIYYFSDQILDQEEEKLEEEEDSNKTSEERIEETVAKCKIQFKYYE